MRMTQEDRQELERLFDEVLERNNTTVAMLYDSACERGVNMLRVISPIFWVLACEPVMTKYPDAQIERAMVQHCRKLYRKETGLTGADLF